jgi:hypothetical protein
MTGALPKSPPRLLRVATVVWLALVSSLVVIDHVRLWYWIEAHPAGTRRAVVARLQQQLAGLQAEVAATERQPPPVSAASYAVAEKGQDERLERLEQSLSDVVAPADLEPLVQRLTRLEGALWRLRHPLPRIRPVAQTQQHRRPITLHPAQVAPPFTVLGTEMRGGEAFLTVAPRDARALSQVLVLRPGEADGDWRLKALDGHTALFESAGHLERVPVP